MCMYFNNLMHSSCVCACVRVCVSVSVCVCVCVCVCVLYTTLFLLQTDSSPSSETSTKLPDAVKQAIRDAGVEPVTSLNGQCPVLSKEFPMHVQTVHYLYCLDRRESVVRGLLTFMK